MFLRLRICILGSTSNRRFSGSEPISRDRLISVANEWRQSISRSRIRFDSWVLATSEAFLTNPPPKNLKIKIFGLFLPRVPNSEGYTTGHTLLSLKHSYIFVILVHWATTYFAVFWKFAENKNLHVFVAGPDFLKKWNRSGTKAELGFA